jgi:hypothetical protein
MRQVRMEVEELRRERTRLKEEIESLQNQRRDAVELTIPDDFHEAVPPPPPVPTVKLKKLSK